MSRLPRLLVLLLVLSACTDVVVPTGSPSTSSTVAATTTTATDPAEAATRAEVEALAGDVERLRGLEFVDPVVVDIVAPGELDDRWDALVTAELARQDLETEGALLRLLGVLPVGVSLEAAYREVYADPVAGWYDRVEGAVVVALDEEPLEPADRAVLVRELALALADQRFGTSEALAELSDGGDVDALLAREALVEGEGAYVEAAWIAGLPAEEAEKLVASAGATSRFDRLPTFLRRQLLFPYLGGLAFLRAVAPTLLEVDAVHERPPVSTEQVIDPEAWQLREAPKSVGILSPVPAGHEVAEASTWGAARLEALLGSVVEAGPLAAAVGGWGGDAYRVLRAGDDTLFQLHLVGDDADDLGELAAAFDTYLRASVAGADAWRLLTDGTTLVVLVADDPATLEVIAVGLVGFEDVVVDDG
ncbi:MAG: hypothetical protein AB1Z55_03640 [Acidimicrobiia bacterium]